MYSKRIKAKESLVVFLTYCWDLSVLNLKKV